MRDNVIALAARFAGGAPIERKGHDWKACRHERTTIDPDLRTVGCRDCGEERLDPIEVLLGLARTWERWQDEYRRLMDARRLSEDHDREVWERRRDRHLNAHPDHAIDVTRTFWERGADRCRTCQRIEQTCPRSVRAALRQARALVGPEGAPA